MDELKARALEDENARLRDRVHMLESRCGHLMVDAERREERARKIAEDCAEHGKEIQYLRHTASWYWDAMTRAEQARMAMITPLLLARTGLDVAAGPIPAADVIRWLDQAVKGDQKAMGRRGYPTLADCLRSDGCAHEGLTSGVRAEVAVALGITAADIPLAA
jgi:hypothetical protein